VIEFSISCKIGTCRASWPTTILLRQCRCRCITVLWARRVLRRRSPSRLRARHLLNWTRASGSKSVGFGSYLEQMASVVNTLIQVNSPSWWAISMMPWGLMSARSGTTPSLSPPWLRSAVFCERAKSSKRQLSICRPFLGWTRRTVKLGATLVCWQSSD